MPKPMPAPQLLAPAYGATWTRKSQFVWQSKGILEPDQFFEVRIRKEPVTTAEYRGVSAPVKDTYIALDIDALMMDTTDWNTWLDGPTKRGESVWWNVALITWDGASNRKPVTLVESELWPFYWGVAP